MFFFVIDNLKYGYDRGRFWFKEKCFIEKKNLMLYMLELRLFFGQPYVSANWNRCLSITGTIAHWHHMKCDGHLLALMSSIPPGTTYSLAAPLTRRYWERFGSQEEFMVLYGTGQLYLFSSWFTKTFEHHNTAWWRCQRGSRGFLSSPLIWYLASSLLICLWASWPGGEPEKVVKSSVFGPSTSTRKPLSAMLKECSSDHANDGVLLGASTFMNGSKVLSITCKSMVNLIV